MVTINEADVPLSWRIIHHTVGPRRADDEAQKRPVPIPFQPKLASLPLWNFGFCIVARPQVKVTRVYIYTSDVH